MKLLTQANRKALPPLYAQEKKGNEAVAYVKFFTPDSNWSWYITEFDGDDCLFCLVDGLELELGYASLNELTTVTGPLGLHVERDKYWEPKTLREIRAEKK